MSDDIDEREIICDSEVDFHKVNTKELGLLLTLSYYHNYTDNHDLSRLCPTRSQRGSRLTITSGVKKTHIKRWGGWTITT
ncbi:Hypothetical predicted protein [Octopus vulgaris]|uniref:Uncharacterized protein n=1 Tax=Octopus vulgaris TaxID=6645 RepID=A0AA36F0D9_OCTVU|nr:Hypothetical predicted protein [Octopus vulgaris]